MWVEPVRGLLRCTQRQYADCIAAGVQPNNPCLRVGRRPGPDQLTVSQGVGQKWMEKWNKERRLNTLSAITIGCLHAFYNADIIMFGTILRCVYVCLIDQYFCRSDGNDKVKCTVMSCKLIVWCLGCDEYDRCIPSCRCLSQTESTTAKVCVSFFDMRLW